MLLQLKKYVPYIAIFLVLVIVEPTINSILNFWLQRIFNYAEPGAHKIAVIRLLTIGFLLWISKRIVCLLSAIIRTKFICDAKRDIKHNIFLNIFKLDTSNVTELASSGDYISIFTNDIYILETRFYNQIIELVSGLFSIVILGGSFFALNHILAASILAFGIISTFVPLFFAKMLNSSSLKYSKTVSLFTQKLKEYIVAFPTIKNYSIEDKITEKFRQANEETEASKFEYDTSLSIANNVGQLLAWFMQFIAVGIGLMLVIKGDILIGTVIAAQSFASDLAMPLQNLISNVNSIKSVKNIVKRIENVSMEAKQGSMDNVQQSESYIDLYAEKCDLIFDDVSFVINGIHIINHFSYQFKSKKKYLIIGVNGSGKSSLFKVAKKWYPLTSGRILVGGKNIKSIPSDEISHLVSYLSETVSLFSGTVKENVTLFRDYEEANYNIVTHEAQVHLNPNRQIIDEGRNISSGEQRRIEIARSLMNSANILIFDEVVSTLDVETAYEIEKLALGMKENTVVFISHNFSGKLIREYDDILVIDNGKLLAHGKYDELLNRSEYFKRICQIKFGI